jgi:acyl carrier protein
MTHSPAVKEEQAQATDLVHESVVKALCLVLQKDEAEMDADTRLFEDLNLDSTSVLELLMAIEDELNVEFDPDSLEQHHFATVGSLCTFIRGSRE